MKWDFFPPTQAPTFMDLGGLPVADDMDGESLKPILLAAAQPLKEVTILAK